MTKVVISFLCCVLILISCKENVSKVENKTEKKSSPIKQGISMELNGFSALINDTTELIEKQFSEDKLIYYKAKISCALSKHPVDSSYNSSELSEELVKKYIHRIAEQQMCRPAQEMEIKNNYFYCHLTCDEYEILLRGTLYNQQIILASSKCKKEKIDEAKEYVLSLKED